MVEINRTQIEYAVRLILDAIGEDPNREGLLDTPTRVAMMYEEVFEGVREDPNDYFDTVYSEDHDELVLVKDITFYSMCEHHLIPFFGKAHVAYIPKNGKVAGLSKLARAVEGIAKRPQLQERITSTLADTIVKSLDPHGVMIVIEAEHMCMTMRGVKKPGSQTVTTAARGSFVDNPNSRNEVLSLINR